MLDIDRFWNPKMEIGVAHLDEHHRTLVKLLFEIKNAADLGHSEAAVRKILEDLVSYTKYHFLAEERYMYEIHYPDLERHRQVHAELSRKVLDLQLRFSNHQTEIKAELFETLKSWYVEHILKMDKQIAVFEDSLRAQGPEQDQVKT